MVKGRHACVFIAFSGVVMMTVTMTFITTTITTIIIIIIIITIIIITTSRSKPVAKIMVSAWCSTPSTVFNPLLVTRSIHVVIRFTKFLLNACGDVNRYNWYLSMIGTDEDVHLTILILCNNVPTTRHMKLLLEQFWCSFTLFHPYMHLMEVTTAI